MRARISAESENELVVMARPPFASPLALLDTPGRGQQLGSLLARSDRVPPGSSFDAVDGVVHGGEQIVPAVSVESVRVGDDPEPCRPIGSMPADPVLVHVAFDRYAETGETGEVVHGVDREQRTRSR